MPRHLTNAMNADPILAYYVTQSGGGLPFPVFAGSPLQRGYGGIFSSLFKFIRPVFSALKPIARKILPTVGTHLASAGKNLVSDIVSGAKVGTSLKKRITEAGENLRDSAVSTLSQAGTGLKRKRRVKRLQFAKRSRRGRNDIFP